MYKIDVNTFHKIEDDKEVKLNEIARIRLRSNAPLFVDEYAKKLINQGMILGTSAIVYRLNSKDFKQTVFFSKDFIELANRNI